MITRPGLTPLVRHTLYWLVGLFSLLLFLKNAWVAEDCFILLRSVDQFLHGNGFRWNPHERVQVYTSPLWFLAVVLTTGISKNLYLDVIGLSLALHLALLVIMARWLPTVWHWSVAVLLLTVSQAFFDFTASGLEYPLVYCLLAAFILLYLRNQHDQDRIWLALCAGLALVTRHDLLCVMLPMILHLAWHYSQHHTRRDCLTALVVLLAPLALWTAFSLVYYGFPFPNTAYAKLGIPGLPLTDRLARGMIYTKASLKVDPVTPVLIIIALCKGLASSTLRLRVLAAGIACGYAYVTVIGGDYMLGRFFTPLYLAAVLLLASATWPFPWVNRVAGTALGLGAGYLLLLLLLAYQEQITQWLPITSATPVIWACVGVGVQLASFTWLPQPWSRATVTVVFALLLFHSTLQHDSPWRTPYKNWGKTADNDLWWMIDTLSRERYWIYRWTSLYAWWHRDPARTFPDHPWCQEGKVLPSPSLVRFSGMMPYCMGTDGIAVDVMGLTDPFVARMPRNPKADWLAGGVNRVIPDGYLDTLATGTNRLTDPNIAAYHDVLARITQSPDLFSAKRLHTIVAFNLGAYDSLLTRYRQSIDSNIIDNNTAAAPASP